MNIIEDCKTVYKYSPLAVINGKVIVSFCDACENLINHIWRYRWHDLRKNPDDMPKYVGIYEVYRPFTEHKYSICYMNSTGTWFDNYIYDEERQLGYNDVIAWREIEKFKEEE